MKAFFALLQALCFLFCILSFQATAQTWQWTHPEKNANPPGRDWAHDIEVDASGNVYVLGDFSDSLFPQILVFPISDSEFVDLGSGRVRGHGPLSG